MLCTKKNKFFFWKTTKKCWGIAYNAPFYAENQEKKFFKIFLKKGLTNHFGRAIINLVAGKWRLNLAQ